MRHANLLRLTCHLDPTPKKCSSHLLHNTSCFIMGPTGDFLTFHLLPLSSIPLLISPLLSLAFHGEGTGMTGGGAPTRRQRQAGASGGRRIVAAARAATRDGTRRGVLSGVLGRRMSANEQGDGLSNDSAGRWGVPRGDGTGRRGGVGCSPWRSLAAPASVVCPSAGRMP